MSGLWFLANYEHARTGRKPSEDAAAAEENGQRYDFVFVDETGFTTHSPTTFASLTASFIDYKG